MVSTMASFQGLSVPRKPVPPRKVRYTPVSTVDNTDLDTQSKKAPGYSEAPVVDQEGKLPRWRPFILKTPFLLFFFSTTVALIVVIEVLYQKSRREKGLFFADTLNDFTTWQNFSYNYLMTIISVLYGMVWASVDLHVKRLEPFFQLASVKGANAANSILLCYPFDFLAFVPITALSRRHWTVFCSGFALVLIFWVITPMQAALLATETVTLDFPTEFVSTEYIIDSEAQATNEVTAQYFYTAYSVAWLDGQLQPFTTIDYAAIPFGPKELSQRGGEGGNETWTAVTRTYTTDLDCTLATIVTPTAKPDPNSWTITNNDGCYQTISKWPAGHNTTGTRNIIYMGSTSYNNADYILNCSTGFLAVWQQVTEVSGKPEPELTAVFCNTNYHYTDMKVTIDANTKLIKSAVDAGVPTALGLWGDPINTGRFEGDVSTAGISPTYGTESERFVSNSPPPGVSRFEDWGLVFPTRQVMYAIGMSKNKTFEDFRDPKVLSYAFAKAHKLLFSNFVYETLRDLPEANMTATARPGNRNLTKVTVVVVRLFARLLEAFLVIVAVCFAALGIVSHRRNANLFGDPDSLAAKMAFVADSKALLSDFDGLDECPNLKKEMKNQAYRLDKWESNGYYRIDFEKNPQAQVQASSSSSSSSNTKKYSGDPLRPFVLKPSVGIAFGLFLVGLLVFLIVLYKSAQKYNGLPVLSGNQVVFQIIFSAIPTVVATGLEPFWVLLTRYFCVYQPWTELARGKASPSKSLALKYTNIPPALVLFRALRAKHLILSSLSATALVANLLAVSLGGLFNSELRPVFTPATFTQPLSAMISTQPQPINITYTVAAVFDTDGTFVRDSQEPWIIAMTNLTQGTPLPPWVSSDHYFLPFEWKDSVKAPMGHKATTRGIGVELDCQPLTSPSLAATVYLKGKRVPGELGINVTVPMDEGETVRCSSPYEYWARGNYLIYTSFDGLGAPGDKLAAEYAFRMSAYNKGTDPIMNQAMNETCRNVLVVGWGRGTAMSGTYSVLDVKKGYTNATLVCQQKLKTAMFEVTVDDNQRVQSYDKVAGSDEDPVKLFKDTTMRNFTAQIATIVQVSASKFGSDALWHNGSYPLLVPHYLMEHHPDLPSTADPNQPIRDFKVYADGYNKIFQLMFAIILGRNSELIFTKQPAGSNTPIEGFDITMVQRVAMSDVMFYISIIIFSLNILVTILAFTFRPKNYLPRFPDTLASEIAYFYSSQALQDVSGTVSMSSASRDKHLNRLGHRYGFGHFKGADGKEHRGVERSSILEVD